MAADLLSGFYDIIDRKNWTVEVIQHRLRINNKLYITIYMAIETEMRTNNILGHRLNKSHVKRQLNLLLADIVCCFSTTFNNIPHSWQDKCLTAITQKCNYNMRQQTIKQGSPEHRSEIMEQDQNLETTPSESESATGSKPETASEPRTVAQYGYLVQLFQPVKPSRSFESPNSGLRYGGLDPKSEGRPEALGAWFGRFDHSGRSFPIVGPLPHFYIDRFYT
jgi:hypothetical protein